MSEGDVQPPQGQGIPESTHAETYQVPEAFFKYDLSLELHPYQS